MDRYLNAIVLIVLLQILEDGLNRSEVQNSFQTNVTTGVILSVPSLLFPSSSSPSPDSRFVKEVTIALASRLAQVPHQEAVLKSLTKIRDAIGVEEFESYLEDYDNKLKKNIEILSKIYNIKSNRKNLKKGADGKNVEKVEKNLESKWENDSDTSGIAEEEDEITNMPAARVVLETEIKFNEETAITMTILEEKDNSGDEQNAEESGRDMKNVIEGKEDLDKRKTPRRVHFGGEIVKLRTPDSDDTESGETTLKTRIPLPISPVTKMPINRSRPSSQPCSPHREPRKYRRISRSVSNSPKREIYTHNAELSPKKSILTRTSSPFLFNNNAVDETRKKKSISRQEDKDNKYNIESSANGKNTKIVEIGGKVDKIKKPEVVLVQNSQNISAINPNIKINHSEDVSLIIETSKNDSKVESDDFGMQNKIIDIKVNKDCLENKTSENIQKNNMEETNESLDINQKVDAFFGSVVKNETELKYIKLNQDGVIRKDVKLKSDKMNSSRNDNSDYVSKSVVCEQISEYDEGSESIIRKNENTIYRSDKMELISDEPNWEDLGLVDHEVLEDLHNKVSFTIKYFIYYIFFFNYIFFYIFFNNSIFLLFQ